VNDGTSRATLCTNDSPMWGGSYQKSTKWPASTVDRLDTVLSAQDIPDDLGMLSIDAKGMDYEVLLGLDLQRWHPRLVVTEDYKANIERKAKYLTEHGYEQVATCDANSFWLRKRT
jgi:hypothetical protein